MVDATGQKIEGNYKSYGKEILNRGIEKSYEIIKIFKNNAKSTAPSPAAEGLEELVPDFENDKNFGMVAKYHIAWDGAIDEVLSESAFFSLAHILETGSELDCSILLSSNLYYKQALQILRNYIENMVLQLHFCDENDDFTLWKAGKYRVPFLRGKNGLLSALKNKGLISSDLVHDADKLYEELNGSIHGAESRLIHRGIFNGNWTGLLFKYERFEEWCNFFSRTVNFGINLLYLHMKHWAKVRPSD